MAIAEIATNQRVAGGGEYYIISRSFGIITGASIGIALFLSRAVSVAFYVIAFAEAFGPVFALARATAIGCSGTSTSGWSASPRSLVLTALILQARRERRDEGALRGRQRRCSCRCVLFFLGSTDYARARGPPGR